MVVVEVRNHMLVCIVDELLEVSIDCTAISASSQKAKRPCRLDLRLRCPRSRHSFFLAETESCC